nr:hypothetical protein [uncultured Blautia sp.]
MKKILCILLTFVLCANSVICVYADDHGGTGGTVGGGDHGGTGGTVGWDELQPVDHTTADLIVGTFLFPNAEGGALNQLSLLNKDNLDDDTKNYIKDNAGDNVRTDGKYYYINNTYINNINQKVQNRVHALNGYYLVESSGALNYDNLNNYYKNFSGNSTGYDNLNNFNYNRLTTWINTYPFLLNPSDSTTTFYGCNPSKWKDTYYFLYSPSNIYIVDMNSGELVSDKLMDFSNIQFTSSRNAFNSYIPCNVNNIKALFGTGFKVFYTVQDIRNYINQGSRPKYYTPKIPSDKTIKVPINFTTINPTLNLDFDVSGMVETQIQGKINLAFQLWLDKLAEINVNPGGGSGGGGSGGGSGGDHGGTGGDLGNPTPTPNPDDGFTSGTYDILEKIYEWLVSFGEKHDIFAKKITDYIEANEGKLDQIIEAINALGNGKTETENNGCKYDFTALSDFMTKLWNESDKKFDNMVSLLEENNKYQQKLVTSLNEIKAILITQTVLELFQDRSSETANKAKDKFPTSIPWDVAMVVNAMAAEPQEIKLTIPVKISSLHIDEELVIDLTGEEWEKLAKTCRYLLSILFILFMVHLSRKMFYSGGDD